MRKYKASVAAVSTDQITIQDPQASIQELEDERNRLREQLAELSSRLSCMEGENVSTAQHKRWVGTVCTELYTVPGTVGSVPVPT